MNRIVDNLNSVKERIANAALRSGRKPDSVKLIVVTKGRAVTDIQTILDSGVNDLGENRIQEAQQKYGEITSYINSTSNITECKWHFVGHLQRNKVKTALEMFSLIHSVDSVRLLEEIANKSKSVSKYLDVLLQVNSTGEKSKFGFEPKDVLDIIKKSVTYSNIRIIGLMTMGVLSTTPEVNRPAFRLLKKLAEQINDENYSDVKMEYLSMGMTNDFEIAIEEGANLVRIGRAIFN